MHTYDLGGTWFFSYAKEYSAENPGAFDREIRVPGYWDDQRPVFDGLDIAVNPEYEPLTFPMKKNRDACTPYIVGTVFYERTVTLTEDAPRAVLTLCGVWTEARVWANGLYVGKAFGYSTPHGFSLDGYLRKGKNTIRIAVDNDPHNHLGTITRGWKGFTGGLCRTVLLRTTGVCRIKDAAVFSRDADFITLDALFDGDPTGAVLSYEITENKTGKTVKTGSFPVSSCSLRRDFSAVGLSPWSDRDPALHRVKLTLSAGDEICDEMTLPLGLRVFERRGRKLYLNGSPIFLRGATEHAYYPETCTAPDNVDAYRKTLRILKDYGFNFLRFHTSVPNEEYMTAMDEEGFLCQIEGPVNFTPDEWEDIVRTCRRHPCACIFCAGNEEWLDEDKLSSLERTAAAVHTLAPACLFNPQEALRGIEYGFEKRKNDPGVSEIVRGKNTYYLHLPRLSALSRFSDVYGQYSWGYVSYCASGGDCHEMAEMYKYYDRPLLTHEMGIFGSYIDLSLEDRYKGTRIGDELYSGTRKYLTEWGTLGPWETYYRNSCYLQNTVRKTAFENARKCEALSGFDYLGAADCHWHHTGYQCGMFNEFYEPKPGTERAEVLRWNSETVVLLDNRGQYTFACGEEISFPAIVSHYGREILPKGTLTCTLSDESGTAAEKTLVTEELLPGTVTEVGSICLTLPRKQEMCTLTLTLRTGGKEYTNAWKLWAFDTTEIPCPCRLAEDILTEEDLQALERGENVILHGARPFPPKHFDFMPMSAGRIDGMTATVIYEHPITNAFPHEGWCDWQFEHLLDNAVAVCYGTRKEPFNPTQFDPIIDVSMGYKLAGQHAVLCEFDVGKGRLLVCGMQFTNDRPECIAMRRAICEYMKNPTEPAQEIPADEIRAFMDQTWEMHRVERDWGYDKAGQKVLSKK